MKKLGPYVMQVLVSCLALAVLAAQLFPGFGLVVNEYTIMLLGLLYFAAFFPQLRRGSIRFPGGSLDWEKEVRWLEQAVSQLQPATESLSRPEDPGLDLLVAELELANLQEPNDAALEALRQRMMDICRQTRLSGYATPAVSERMARLARRLSHLSRASIPTPGTRE